jgi:valyl-tRNA synthetase
VDNPLDAALLARLSTVVDTATRCFDAYDHTGALTATESFFWAFCDDYIELVKERAYGSESGSARAALRAALSVQLRLFAPFLPYVTEEVWSWFQPGSVHRSNWPAPTELAGGGDAEVLDVVSTALAQVRRAKSARNQSMRAEVALATVRAPAPALARLARAEADLRAAGRIAKLDLVEVPSGDLTVTCDTVG